MVCCCLWGISYAFNSINNTVIGRIFLKIATTKEKIDISPYSFQPESAGIFTRHLCKRRGCQRWTGFVSREADANDNFMIQTAYVVIHQQELRFQTANLFLVIEIRQIRRNYCQIGFYRLLTVKTGLIEFECTVWNIVNICFYFLRATHVDVLILSMTSGTKTFAFYSFRRRMVK